MIEIYLYFFLFLVVFDACVNEWVHSEQTVGSQVPREKFAC